MINPCNMFGSRKAGDGGGPVAPIAVWDFSDASSMFTDDGVTNVSSDGDLIYRINDLSGNGYHLRQTTEANRPTYRTNVQNSLSAGEFDSASDQYMDNSGFTLALPLAVIAAVRPNNTDSTVIGHLSGFATPYLQKFSLNALWDCGGTAAPAPSTVSVWQRYTAEADSVNGSIQVNDGVPVQRNVGTRDFSTGIRMGRTYYGSAMEGYIGQVAMFSGINDLSDYNQAIDVKWDLPGA